MQLILDRHTPRWLHAVQIFWLGGVGLNNAIIWIPFIRKAFQQTHRVTSLSIVKQPTATRSSRRALDVYKSSNQQWNGLPLDEHQLEMLADISRRKDFEIV